ncbi:DNA gyrase/topoisomerase IV subunit A [Serinibacter salmoneus]|nr:DNA topoisomerase IV subunit A [Serinibacter salmoneus]
MSRSTPSTAPGSDPGRVVDIDVASEMQDSFLEYAYSVIYARALPDARDGLKPVQRRILFQMAEMNLRPDRGHVKSSRVVGDVMGKLHPHSDVAIYDALVRMAQPFALRLPLVDGHGNFGSLDNGPAAPRYTEARLAPAAMVMTADIDEDVVQMVPNYDNQLLQPEVLPSALPNLLVNGASGIAVGMATNMAPHNLVEVVAAARHLIAHPEASLEDLMRFVPGPDLPTGGKIIGLEGIREAYATGRGSFRTRATTRVENITARRKGIVISELPYLVGPEKAKTKIIEAVRAKKVQGVHDVVDLSDRSRGTHLVVEVKSGFNPEAVLAQLFRHTPLEDSFGINNVALVQGQPRTLGLRELLRVYVDHRFEVVRRRTEFRLARRRERLHLVEGLLIAVLDIDEVIAVIRSSDDAAAARTRLQAVFDLSQPQADYILELQLRRLTKFSLLELQRERDELVSTITELEGILADPAVLHALVSDELAQVAAEHGTPRRTVLLESAGNAVGPAARGAAAGAGAIPLEVPDAACQVVLSVTGLLARTADDALPPRTASRARHDALRSSVATTARATLGVVTSRGRIVELSALDAPTLPATDGPLSIAGGVPITELVTLERGERAIALTAIDEAAPTLALATARGTIKRVAPSDRPVRGDAWECIALKEGDELVAATPSADDDELVLVTSGARLLRFPAAAVRPQGRGAAGMAGVRVEGTDAVLHLASLAPARAADAVVVTIAGSSDALPGTAPGSVKVSPLELYPAKGRGTAGVRAHRLLRGEDALVLAWVGPHPAHAVAAGGQSVDLPDLDERRDGSGRPLSAPVVGIG